MERRRGESGLTPRLFLVAPEKPATELAACLEAALALGDVASLVISGAVAPDLIRFAQVRGVAVLLSGAAELAIKSGCDGVHLDAATDDVRAARDFLGQDRILGAFAGHSRHLAMEAAEAGADYIAFAQNGPSIGGVPLVAWWAEIAEIPCVAFDPVEPDGLDILLPQTPDFIRPSDTMWESSDEARRVIAALTNRLAL